MKNEDTKQKVLIVDDQHDVIYTISVIFKKLNIEILSANNGRDGIEIAEKEQPDMIILDIYMPPGIDGFQVCEELKNRETTKHIPVMFLTSKFLDIKSKAKGLDIGADDYLLKPFDPLELVSRVKVMLRLRDALNRLEQKNRHYMEMLGFISHELKNPLTSILGAAETLKNGIVGQFSSDQQKLIDIMDRNAAYIQSMIERYLNLSKLEKGEIIKDCRETNFVNEVLMPILANIQILLQKNKKKVSAKDNSLKDNYIINSDPELLKVVLNNLFSNAIKYSDEKGEIIYNIFSSGDKLYFEIQNSSAGLRTDEIQQLFNKFGRLRNNITLKQKGTGLGLYNSKEIMKILGGSIMCESKQDEYVRFVVDIPVK
ncbi:hybrid sensor histidine kinase/response regulator [Candidatus Dependentiae bacterium]|nr:hybrid sensor histidine kinase/response regulator [Candidatus Dependentiae bacterium]